NESEKNILTKTQNNSGKTGNLTSGIKDDIKEKLNHIKQKMNTSSNKLAQNPLPTSNSNLNTGNVNVIPLSSNNNILPPKITTPNNISNHNSIHETPNSQINLSVGNSSN